MWEVIFPSDVTDFPANAKYFSKGSNVSKDRFQPGNRNQQWAQHLLTMRSASHIFPSNHINDFWLDFLVVWFFFFNKEHTKHFQQRTSLCMMLLCVKSFFTTAGWQYPLYLYPLVHPRKTYLDRENFIFSYGYPCEHAFCKYTSTAVFYFSVLAKFPSLHVDYY